MKGFSFPSPLQSFPLAVLLWTLLFQTCPAIVFYNLDNSANTTDPANGAPFSAVAQVVDSTGLNISGTAIHLGNGYMLTADHVSINNSISNYVTFDGVTKYSIDPTYNGGLMSQQVATGLDMKIFKLNTVPTTSTVNLWNNPAVFVSPAMIIGAGVGRSSGSALGASSVNYGNATTAVKRWGANVPIGLQSVSYSGPVNSYTENIIVTALGSSGNVALGDSEAGLAPLDSGGGLFQNISGTWYLIGLNVLGDSPTTFGTDNFTSGSASNSGSLNGFVRISDYYSQIQSLSTIPEPDAATLLVTGLLLACLARRTRCLLRATGPLG